MVIKETQLEQQMGPEKEPEDAGTHGGINPSQAAEHVQALDRVMDVVETKAKEGEVQDIT